MITRYDPCREALSLRRAMDQLFEQGFVHPGLLPGSPPLTVPMDICETQNRIFLCQTWQVISSE